MLILAWMCRRFKLIKQVFWYTLVIINLSTEQYIITELRFFVHHFPKPSHNKQGAISTFSYIIYGKSFSGTLIWHYIKIQKRLNGILTQIFTIIKSVVLYTALSNKDTLTIIIHIRRQFSTAVYPYKYSRTSIIRISIIRTLSYPNAISNFTIPKYDLIFCNKWNACVIIRLVRLIIS